MAVNRFWLYSKLATVAVLLSGALFMFAVSSGIAPCNKLFAQTTSCNVGDTETFTGPTQFQGELEVGATPTAGSAGQAIFSQGSGSPPEWGYSTVWIYKGADESVAGSTTLQNDDQLFFTAAANGVYLMELYLRAGETSAGDIKFSLAGAGATSWCIASSAGNPVCGTPESGTISISNSGDEIYGRIVFLLTASAGGGTVNLQWAQASASGTTTMDEQTSMAVTRLS